MTGSMECSTLLLPDFGRQGPLGLGDAGFGSLGRVLAGKARYVMSWSGAAWKDEVRQAWLVQVCCGASGRVKVRYGGAGMAWQGGAGHGGARHGTARQAWHVVAR